MRTFKRNIPEIDTDLNNYNKYFNQLNFKGISEDDNIYQVDQESFRDVKNVYLDEHDHFVSRESLQTDINLLEDIKKLINLNLYSLINIYNVGIGKLWVMKFKTNNTYSLFLITNDSQYHFELTNINKYHISVIEHYVIVFNDSEKGAQIFDTNQDLTAEDAGWKDLDARDTHGNYLYLDIPVTKIVTGGSETIKDGNGFTDAKNEEYIWNNNSRPTLPAGNATVEVSTTYNKDTWELPNTNILTDYRTLKTVNYSYNSSELFSIAKGRICIANSLYFKYSLTAGEAFTKVYYPSYTGTFLDIASVSKDGLYFFFVTSNAIYRYTFVDDIWEKIDVDDTIPYLGVSNTCCFLTKDIFSFVVQETGGISGSAPQTRLYFKGPGLYSGEDKTKDNILSYIDLTEDNIFIYTTTAQYAITMYLTNENAKDNTILLCNFSKPYTENNKPKAGNYFIYCYGGDTSAVTHNNTMLIYKSLSSYEIIYSIKAQSTNEWYNGNKAAYASKYSVIATKRDYDKTPSFVYQYEATLYIGYEVDETTTPGTPVYIQTNYINLDREIGDDTMRPQDTLHYMLGGYIGGNNVISDFTGKWQLSYIPVKPNNGNIFTDGDYFYAIVGNKIYTNQLLDDNNVIITYHYPATTKYKQIPQVSYADTQLYLGFNNLLQITSNITKDDKLLLNLPPINNQSFLNNITGLRNISTTEVAIFFKDRIVICSKQTDENYGYRYDYYNTKLSTGIRLGDDAINTLEGSYTIFPTQRGLALMNYQAFMATTDQTLQFITDSIKHIWQDFYNTSSIIKIIQWRNYLVLTNGTGNILLYDVNKNYWWRWEVPVNTLIALTDQIKLRLITLESKQTNGTLTVFTNKYIVNDKTIDLNYYDFSSEGKNITIDWFVKSQPLHFKAPNYYKNIKQLVFQFFDETEALNRKTMLAQIKLYRKRVTIRDPETVAFKVEELRTFVKRFNYWKINELQWGLANDTNNAGPKQLLLNGISIKYEIGEEVR